MPFDIPNVADAGFADQAEPDSVDFDIITAGFARTGVFGTGSCAVTAQGVPDMTVAVAAGTVIINEGAVAVTSGNVTITTAHATLARFDLIVVNNSGTKSAVAGTASANPAFPAVPANSVVLAAVYVPAGDTAINSNQITDKRLVISGGGATLLIDAVSLSTVISPAQLTANTDNWNPAGLSTAGRIRMSTDATRNLTGIAAPATDGRMILLENVGAFSVNIVHDSTSTATNRFYVGAANAGDGFILAKNQSVLIIYDMALGRWKLFSTAQRGGAVPQSNSGAGANGASMWYSNEGHVHPADSLNKDTLWNAAGDLVYGTGADAAAILAAGIALRTLRMNNAGTAPEWAAGLTMLSDNILGSAAASMVLSSITSNYQNLLLLIEGRSAKAALQDGLDIRFNGDTTAVYDNVNIYGPTVSGNSTVGDTAAYIGDIAGNNASGTRFGFCVVFIPNYINSSRNKNVYSLNSVICNTTSTDNYMMVASSMWRNATPATITSITLFAEGGNLSTGFRCTAYGLGV